MPEPQLGYFFPVSEGHPGHPLPKPPISGGIPTPPIQLPPLPPDTVEPPIVLPPTDGGDIEFPIVIPKPPINLPPGTVWPPLPPDAGIAGKMFCLVWIVGVGYRWVVLEGPSVWPPIATPK